MEKKIFKLIVAYTEENFTIESENDGFTPLELLGILEYKKSDIYSQMSGKIKPDIIKRKVKE